ncbi:MAG: J domain-containing protein, partial [Acidimicrobiales bacterium]
MARPWSRKRNEEAPEPAPTPAPSAEDVRLDGDDHAWWSQTDVNQAWTPRARQPVEATEEREILAEHFGDDWRMSFGFTPPSEDELTAEADREQQARDDEDPYKVLQVDPSSTWDEIVAAHRHQARVHHPDRLFGQSEEAKEKGEDRIRIINAAYQELRVRRSK